MADLVSVRQDDVSAGQRAHLRRSAAILQRIFTHYEPVDFAVQLWDGSRPITPVDGEPRFRLIIKHAAALRRMFLPPSEINLGEAYIFNDFDIEGDIFAAAGLMDYFSERALSAADITWLTRQLLSLPRDVSQETVRPGLRPAGAEHSQQRDRQSV